MGLGMAGAVGGEGRKARVATISVRLLQGLSRHAVHVPQPHGEPLDLTLMRVSKTWSQFKQMPDVLKQRLLFDPKGEAANWGGLEYDHCYRSITPLSRERTGNNGYCRQRQTPGHSHSGQFFRYMPPVWRSASCS